VNAKKRNSDVSDMGELEMMPQRNFPAITQISNIGPVRIGREMRPARIDARERVRRPNNASIASRRCMEFWVQISLPS
jgi:hypothetical protein